jgi:hypothetical protein
LQVGVFHWVPLDLSDEWQLQNKRSDALDSLVRLPVLGYSASF